MKQFKDLNITGPEEQLLAFIGDVSAKLPAHWRRDQEAEARLERVALEGKNAGFVFTCVIPGTQYLIHGILDGRGERKGPSETNGNQVSCPQNPVSTEFHK